MLTPCSARGLTAVRSTSVVAGGAVSCSGSRAIAATQAAQEGAVPPPALALGGVWAGQRR